MGIGKTRRKHEAGLHKVVVQTCPLCTSPEAAAEARAESQAQRKAKKAEQAARRRPVGTMTRGEYERREAKARQREVLSKAEKAARAEGLRANHKAKRHTRRTVPGCPLCVIGVRVHSVVSSAVETKRKRH